MNFRIIFLQIIEQCGKWITELCDLGIIELCGLWLTELCDLVISELCGFRIAELCDLVINELCGASFWQHHPWLCVSHWIEELRDSSPNFVLSKCKLEIDFPFILHLMIILL